MENSRNKLKELNKLFSQFVEVLGEINLHENSKTSDYEANNDNDGSKIVLQGHCPITNEFLSNEATNIGSENVVQGNFKKTSDFVANKGIFNKKFGYDNIDASSSGNVVQANFEQTSDFVATNMANKAISTISNKDFGYAKIQAANAGPENIVQGNFEKTSDFMATNIANKAILNQNFGYATNAGPKTDVQGNFEKTSDTVANKPISKENVGYGNIKTTNAGSENVDSNYSFELDVECFNSSNFNRDETIKCDSSISIGSIIEYNPFSDDEEIIEDDKVLSNYTIIANADGIIFEEVYFELENASSKCIELPVVTDLEFQPDQTLEVNGTIEVSSQSSGPHKRLKAGCSQLSVPTPTTGPRKLVLKSGSCDKSKMTVPTSAEKNKKNCCPFCLKLQSKFARHVMGSHNDEADVQNLLQFPKGSKERKTMFDSLRKRGNFEFDTDSTINNGQLIVIRRPNPKFNRDATDFITCHTCYGMYLRTCSRQHQCSRQLVKGDRSAIYLSRMVEGRIHVKASAILQKILSVMKEDEISNLIKFDWLLIQLGNEMSEAYDYHKHHSLVRSRLRLLARMLIQLKKIQPEVTDFASLYNPIHCDSVIEAISAVAGFRTADRLFNTPYNATKSVTEVKRVAKILNDHCIENQNKALQEQVKDFLSLFSSRAVNRINKLAMNTIIKMKRMKDEVLPTDEDIQKFSSFLNKKRKECFISLKACPMDESCVDKWTELSEITMVSLILFCRRRVGEMENTEVLDFLRRKRTGKSKDQLFQALTKKGKERVSRYSRMLIRGKLNNTVPILLQTDVEKCLELIISYRKAAGVASDNDLLFALPSADDSLTPRYISGCRIMKKFSELCGAESPENLRGTKLRKHFANFCAIERVDDNTITDISKFMGHSVLIHKNTYRGNELNREIARMSELLEGAVGSQVAGNIDDGDIDDVDIDDGDIDDVDIDDGDIDDEDNENNDPTPFIDVEEIQANIPFVGSGISSKRKRKLEAEDGFVPKKISRKRRTIEEKALLEKVFHNHLKNGTIPKKSEIEAHQASHVLLKNRPYQTIQKWIVIENKSHKEN